MTNKNKKKNCTTPIEKHDSAAWANIETQKPVSKVAIPNEFNVGNAKSYVDTNQK